ncbi:DnaJ C-terminal domain-containing protein [Caenimonas aquaedulcis]|uniref:DnaJ domain-containing protein n=1 Tax=Caenimonas aquaedulcis TaxID=2793270 RepID=A0A931H1W1_9BURK|nr:DnaJ C-terminal domain-containing protein [Caenimonas aquaedulcis]MBG9387056.1 DnaJ domain-containing protein [Caenimonas aquaedulcis]
MDFKDYYKILGVEKTATEPEIKKAYRKLARKYHPDVSKEADAAVRMSEVNEANAVLSDPEKRAAYDSLGSQPHAQAGRDFRPPPNWDAGFEFTGDGQGGGQFSDFFEELFGRAAHGQRAQAAGRRPAASRGEDHHARIELDLLDAYHGAQRTISLRQPRLDEQGRVVMQDHQLEVKIPTGVREGQHIRLAGRGEPGYAGGPPGDLLLEVAFKPDARWCAEGRDVYQRVPLAPWEAALGGPVVVGTPTGDAEVTVPAGWKPGRKLRLKGRGIPGKDPGDLYLELELALPPTDTEAAREAFAALAKAFPSFDARRAQGA